MIVESNLKMDSLTFNIITNFCNHSDIEAINDRKKSEKFGKDRKESEKNGKCINVKFNMQSNRREL